MVREGCKDGCCLDCPFRHSSMVREGYKDGCFLDCPFRHSSMVRNGFSNRTQLLPTRPRQLRNGCGGTFRPSSAPGIGPRAVQTSTPLDKKPVVCSGGHGVPKASQQPGEPEEILCEGSGIDPNGDGGCGDSRVAGASQGLASRQRAAILSDITINQNLKLAPKLGVLFNP